MPTQKGFLPGARLNLLLDTHIWLWWLNGNSRLSANLDKLISSPDNTVVVSAISLWEVAIKSQTGKLRWNGDLVSASKDQSIEFLAFDEKHAAATIKLPDHHKDPFDRAILAQAMVEELELLTADSLVKQYEALVKIRFQN